MLKSWPVAATHCSAKRVPSWSAFFCWLDSNVGGLIRGFVPMANGTKAPLANAGHPSERAAMFLFFPLVEAVVKEVMDSVGLDLGG